MYAWTMYLNINIQLKKLIFRAYECLLASIYVHHMHTWCLQRSKEGIRSLELELLTIVNHLDPQKEQQVFLTAESFLQSL